MQTLSVSGTVGFLALLAYLYFLICVSLRMAPSTRGVSLALLTMIMFRCISEAPLVMTGLIDAETLTHFILFMILLREPVSETVRYAPVQTLASYRP
jgi:Na+/H+ antiporter NhaD/arsenite permease-like protein